MIFEKELTRMLWKIDKSEIKMRNRPNNNVTTPTSNGTNKKKPLVRMVRVVIFITYEGHLESNEYSSI